MYNHPEYHEPSNKPVLNCPLCDAEVDRPVVRGFGKGISTSVVPRKQD